ncbi:MAG TPA: GerMN domain-containing protein [Dermatophilaceae bacterium]|nr:GerMN domain-containing protein [Dermatophilaceae bacterium]
MQPTRRPGLWACLTAAAVMVTGCGGLAAESSVQPGLRVDAGGPPAGRVLYPGPVNGMTQEQIVRGFVRAGAASDGDYRNARLFLAGGPQKSWRPDAAIIVFSDFAALTTTLVDDTTVRLHAEAVATIDSSGHYTQLPPGTVVDTTMRMVQDRGQWRVNSLNENFGRWLSAADLQRLYRPYNVYYLAGSGNRRLVPDVRWFALDRLATRLARAQLEPVPDYLDAAAKSAIPSGARLTVDAVPVEGGVASVDLTTPQLDSEPATRQNIWAQFVATLTQAPEVQRVALTVEGAELMPGFSQPPATVEDLGFPTIPEPEHAKPLLRRSNGRVITIESSALLDPSTEGPTGTATSYPVLPSGWVGMAESLTGLEIAAVSGDRSQLARWRGADRIAVPPFAGGLSRPAYDRHDMLWVGGIGSGRYAAIRVWAINAAADPSDRQNSAPRPIPADWLRRRVVASLKVSADGQRIAVLSTNASGGDPHVDISGIVRAPNGIPERLSGHLRVGATLTMARDVVWVDAVTVAILGRVSPRDPVKPYIVPLGGPMDESLDPVAGAVTLTTTGGPRGLVVTTDKGSIVVRAGRRWVELGQGLDLAVAGV